MDRKKFDWVVIDIEDQVLRCERCKETESLSIIIGKSVGLASGYMRAFITAHKDCKVQDAET